MNKVFHKKDIPLKAKPHHVHRYITTPACVADYYPGVLEFGELDEGNYFYCRNKFGISLFQITENQSLFIQFRIWTAPKCSKPYTAHEIIDQAAFIMDENWELAENQSGTMLTKTWLNLNKIKRKFLPIAMIVKLVSGPETKHLIKVWNSYED